MDSREEIFYRLRKQWSFIVSQGYDSERILGIFLYGSQNYNTAIENSDIDSKVIYLPTFEQFCLTPELVSKEYEFYGEHIEVKDLRLMRSMWMKQNINFVEILFTEYYILNPRYEGLFKKFFFDNAEAIAHYDRNRAVKSISAQLLNTLEQDRQNFKKLYNSWRLYYFLNDYVEDKPYTECLKQVGDKHDFLMSLRSGTNSICRDRDSIVTNSYELNYKVRKLVEGFPNLDSPQHGVAAAALDEGVIEILKASFTNATFPSSSKETFMDDLTKTEKAAFDFLVKEMGQAEATVIISKLIESSGISRPVFNSVLTKMKESNVATIVNKGAKGTTITIINPYIKEELEKQWKKK